jgi:hypothetical protein
MRPVSGPPSSTRMAGTLVPETGRRERIIRVVDEEHSLAYHCDGRPGELRAIPPESKAAESGRVSTDSPGAWGLRGILGPQALGDATPGKTSVTAARDALLLVVKSITLSPFASQALLRFAPAMTVAAGSGVARRPVETA